MLPHGFTFEIIEKVFVILGFLYLIEEFNINIANTRIVLTMIVLIGTIAVYSMFAHMKLPYGIEY